MSCSDGNKKKKNKQSSINFLACTKFKSNQNNNTSPRPITNIAFCSYIQQNSSDEEDLPRVQGIEFICQHFLSRAHHILLMLIVIYKMLNDLVSR